MRKPVTPERLERFLSALGARVRHPARVMITGGASMLRRGLRGETLGVDLAYEIDPRFDTEIALAIRDLKNDLDINVELAEPGQFIPVPSDRRSRFEHVGRFGEIDVYLDDPYTIALGKLDRGSESDLRDVRLLQQAGLVDLTELEAKAREIASPETQGFARVDLDRLLARLAFVRGDAPPA